MLKKIDFYAYSVQKGVYRRDFDETKFLLVFFLIKEENVFNKYNKIWEKFSKIIKKRI